MPSQPREATALHVRKNLNETAFFYPHLQTDEEGHVIIRFTIPEALTKWKFMGLSHNKELQIGRLFGEVVTQKELMILPNAPRFFREGDELHFTAKVSNMADKDLSGTAQLQLFDALTMKPIDSDLGNMNASIPFETKKGQSAGLSWKLKIPQHIQAVTYRVIARSGTFSDGEENVVPVLSNRMLVTESLPLPIRSKQTKTFTLNKLLRQRSKTLKHHKLSLEFTSNPAWYAVQTLPYLMEYPYQCSEQIFSRYYANSMAAHIAGSNPKIERIFKQWRNTDALVSNLEKNQELKALLLEATPWVLQAKNETEQKKRIGLLFDLNRMSRERNRSLMQLKERQTPNGGWAWFPGMEDNRYITQYIITGLGHLQHLGIEDEREDGLIHDMIAAGIRYLDERMQEDYQDLLDHDADMEKDHLSYVLVQYLYARSYFLNIPVKKEHKTAFAYWEGQARKYWLKRNKYMQGMISLALHRLKDKETPMDILRSLKEKALVHEELGMYWKENTGGYYWFQAPIETQALLIEAFDEVGNDQQAVDNLKVWLLKQKQTQSWPTTKATAEACYALLLRGTDWLANEALVEITVGNHKLDPQQMPELKAEVGTGYFKTSWDAGEIKSNMGRVTVSKKDEGVAWGSLYWQYFEQLDKITPHETPMQLKKKLFVEKNTTSGPVIRVINQQTKLKPGDKVKVRIELKVDRDMEFVHMKDMRASGFEPVNVLSSYRYQDGLGYYQSTRDAATHFFFSRLPRGTYVFEYSLMVQHKGNFSNGITSIQCMYTPEFTAHSEGTRVSVW